MFAALVLLAAVGADPMDETRAIYRAAKVGDWIELTSVNAAKEKVVTRHSVIAKTDDFLTLRMEASIDGKAGPPYEHKYPLKPVPKPKDEPEMFKTVVEKLDAGTETLTAAGKKLECTWEKSRTTITYKLRDKEIATVILGKSWRSPEVPLGGAVRTETETDRYTTVSELTGFGRGK